MKKINYLIIIVAVFCGVGTSLAQAPDWLWSKAIGGTGNDIGRVVAIDDSSNTIVAGSFEGTVDFDPGPGVFNLTSAGLLDAFFLKLDAAGNFLWAQSLGGTQSEVVTAIALDAGGNIYMTGRFGNTVDFDPGPGVNNITAAGTNFDFFITKFSGNGIYQWAEAMSGQGDTQCMTLKLDTAGNIYGAGYFQGTADFNPSTGVFYLTSNGNSDVFVFKLENSGGFIWAKSFGGVLYETAMSLSVDGVSNVYVTGYYNGNIDFDPGPAVVNLQQTGGNDIFISKFTEAGIFVWAKSMGGNQQDVGNSTYADYDGNIYTSGNFLGSGDFNPGGPTVTLSAFGNADIYTSKLNMNGDYVWAHSVGSFGNSGIDNNYSMAADADGNIYTSGYFNSVVDFNPGAATFSLTSSGGNDGYITKLDSSGNFIWVKKIGGGFSDIAHSIAIDNSNRLVVTGSFMSGSLAMDADTIFNTSAPQTAHIFVAMLDSAVNTTGMNSLELANAISVYPNPARDRVVVSFPFLNGSETVITIMDIAGKEIFSAVTEGEQRYSILTGAFANGLYIIKIQSGGFVSCKKVLIEK